MTSLKQIILYNIQSHTHTTLDLPETGVIRISGDNSNGKSVFVKGLWDIVSGNISRPKYRQDIIRRGCLYGELTFTLYSGLTLFAHIHLDASQTFAELRRPNQSVVRRYLSDKSIGELVSEFGLHYSDEFKISINIHKDDDQLLFVSTPHKVNYALSDSIIADAYAETALGKIDEITLECKREIKTVSNNVTVAKTALGVITLYDLQQEEAVMLKAKELAHILENCDVGAIPLLIPVPDITVLHLFSPPPDLIFVPEFDIMQMIPHAPHLNPPPPAISPIDTALPDLLKTFSDLSMFLNNVCPVCKRSF